ncbi:VanZ family protein [Peribacillus frigoritolerans]|uniref:VanZ family protein n=2 Tax=Peribacillus frigoritolerans TaxID=450367 RepID=UPI003D277BBE
MLNGLYPSIIIITFFVLFCGFKFFKGYISLLRYFYWIIFGIFLTGLVVFTLFPFPYQKYLIQVMIEDNLGVEHNLIPFNGVKEANEFGYFSTVLKQYALNILLFIPLGFALPILFSKIKIKHIILIGFLTSLTIEVVQAIAGYFIGYNYRSFDIDDLIMNSFGTIIGLLIFKVLFKFLKNNQLLSEK